MLLISPTDHQKFIAQCYGVVYDTSNKKTSAALSEQLENLTKDLTELQQLMDTYSNLISDLPRLTNAYNLLQTKIRVKTRKIKVSKGTGDFKNL